MCFFWASLEKQLRVEGVVTRLTREESESYFRTRPRLSQLGAWTSHQSAEITNHKVLEDHLAETEKKFAGQEIPCPPFWGGFHLIPAEFEFWIGQRGRLHERYVYERQGSTDWRRFMRSP